MLNNKILTNSFIKNNILIYYFYYNNCYKINGLYQISYLIWHQFFLLRFKILVSAVYILFYMIK